MTKTMKPWVPIDKIDAFVQLEPALLTLGLALGAWLTYKIFLRKISEERNRTLKTLFRNLGYHLTFGTTLFILYAVVQQFPYKDTPLERLLTYVGLGTILAGATVFVKVWRILVFEYLYLSHMKVAFPLLLVNLFTLLLSLVLGSWIGTEIFNIRLAPILATSAIFSLVLGLALQDTLGNLFSGVALQFDKPYEIGDWVEVHMNGQKWIGRVDEITWRATVLIGFGDEAITIPNRVMGQALIANFAAKYRPIARILFLRLPFKADVDRVKGIILGVLDSIPEIQKTPVPGVLVAETNESGILFKLVYYLYFYGDQYLVADKVFSVSIAQLKKAGYATASHQIEISSTEPTQRSAMN